MKKVVVSFLACLLTLVWLEAGTYETITIIDASAGAITNAGTLTTARRQAGGVVLAGTNASAVSNTYHLLTNKVLVPASTLGIMVKARTFGYNAETMVDCLVSTEKSYDGTYWIPSLGFNFKPDTTNWVTVYTNITIADYGYFRVANITNAHEAGALALTNLVIKVFHK
jgi:hypothetical protein